MVGSGGTQAAALVAAFVFGIVVLAATGAVILCIKANGSPPIFFRDKPRLALVFFLTLSALWGLLGFIATLVNADATSGCRVVISFAAAFDQLARVSLQQSVLWGINGGHGIPKASLVLQTALSLRFGIGAVFVGVQRPQFRPVCVARNPAFPVGMTVIAIDALMALVLSIMACFSDELGVRRSVPGAARNKALLFVTSALGIWTALSIPGLLGLESASLAVRTALPAAGLLIPIGSVMLLAGRCLTSTAPPPLHRKTPSMESPPPPAEIPPQNLRNEAIFSQHNDVVGDAATVLLINNLEDNAFPAENDADELGNPSSPLIQGSIMNRPRPIPRESSLSAAVLSTMHVNVNTQRDEGRTPPATPKDTSQQMLPVSPAANLREVMSIWAGAANDGESQAARPGKPRRQMQPIQHYRVGEVLPTFSVRKKSSRSRKFALPTPLALHKPTQVAIIAEPDVSRHAVDKIQELLRQLDVPDRGDSRATISEQQRTAILADIESEMGVQAFHWQKMRQDLTQGSPSTATWSPCPASSACGGFKASSAAATCTDRHRPPANVSNRGLERLAAESVENKANCQPTSSTPGSRNLLSVTNRTLAQPGSNHTPPDADGPGGGDVLSGVEALYGEQPSRLPRTSRASLASSLLVLDQILRATDDSDEPVVDSPETPVRPAAAMPLERLPSTNSHLEKRPRSMPNALTYEAKSRHSPAHDGRDQQPQQCKTRPLTQRPLRQRKRTSLLPDILESPKPLGKRDFLGVYQFPRGEKPGSAAAQPRSATVGGGDMRGSRPSERATSAMSGRGRTQDRRHGHTDTVVSPNAGKDYVDGGDGGSGWGTHDDDFDEATLWEIASLLKPR